MKTLFPITAAAMLLVAPALAHDHAAFSYTDFEISIPHIDLETCPDGLAKGDFFCRITMNGDALHVFVFEAEGDRNFVSVHTYHEDEFQLDFEQ